MTDPQITRKPRKITFNVQQIGTDISMDEAIRRMTGLNDIDIARLNRGQETCEYNPVEHRAAYTLGDPGACCRVAEIGVGHDGKWHLCTKCSELPEFRRYRVRERL